jgi:hypothetical protein
MENIGDFLTD